MKKHQSMVNCPELQKNRGYCVVVGQWLRNEKHGLGAYVSEG